MSNRELKFRAWDDADEVMSWSDSNDDECYFGFDEGKVKAWISETVYSTGAIDGPPEPPEFVSRELPDLMQWTGLCDKNGKEIYEGDIVRGTMWAPWDEAVPVTVTGVIAWIKGGFWFEGHNTGIEDCPVADMQVNYKVIGNIHENPELLERT